MLTSKKSLDILMELMSLEKKGKLDCDYFDEIPAEVYHDEKCPGVSSTRLKMVYKNDTTPVSETESLKFGRAFHSYILEPDLFFKDFAVGQIEVGSMLPFISMAEYNLMKEMKVPLEAHPEYKNLFEGSAKERTFFSRDNVTGILKKCRTDAIKGLRISDIKTTTNASEQNIVYSSKKYGYGFSAAYYLGVVSEVLGTRTEDFKIVAVEKKDNPKIGIYKPTLGAIEKYDLQVREALETLQAEREMKFKPWVGSSPEIKEIWL